MAKTEITARCFLQTEDGKLIPFEELTKEEKDEAFAKMSKRLSEGMSRYYAQHPEEFKP